jgi:hypothetical protein
MAGKEKYAQRLAKHLGTQVDAACAVSKPGNTATLAIGGALGAAAAAARAGRAGESGGEITVGSISWLGLGPDGFTLTKGDMLMGKPKGEPFAQVPYSDVSAVELTEGKLTMRTDVVLNDGRAFAFESKRIGPANKPNVEVLELFKQRCGG